MTHVQGFDNMDDMFAAMDAAETEANLHLTPGQIRLRDAVGREVYFVRVCPEMGGLIIYGKVPAVAEMQKAADFDVVENRTRGYLTGQAFSAWEPTGEHGDTHVANVIPITALEFTAAEAMGWPDLAALAASPEGHLLGNRLYEREQEARV